MTLIRYFIKMFFSPDGISHEERKRRFIEGQKKEIGIASENRASVTYGCDEVTLEELKLQKQLLERGIEPGTIIWQQNCYPIRPVKNHGVLFDL